VSSTGVAAATRLAMYSLCGFEGVMEFPSR
jgi:hypothetical protein